MIHGVTNEAATMDSKIEKQAFTLAMLGTLTDFTPELKQTARPSPYTKGNKVKNYPKGETLSIVASLIKTASPAKITKVDAKNPYPYQSDEVAVINGPTTDGSNIGEKIALGLAAILNALVRGQTRINLIAHSRGVVESILIAHELEAIRNIIVSCANFDEVSKQLTEQQTKRHKGKPTNNTPSIIEVFKAQINLIPKEKLESWFNCLKTNLPHATMNLFGLDPVPGDCFPITWYDERFFILPEIIKNTELIYYANEHSDWGFTPIFPEVASKEKQHFVRYSMPGHHGTGSTGNNGSQQGVIISPDGSKTTHVQKLLIMKLLSFLSVQEVIFNDGRHIFHEHNALGKRYLGVAADAPSIDIANLDYPAIFHKLYTVIAQNQLAYEAFNATNYPYVGSIKQRRALLKGHTYGLFNTIFTAHSNYINEEHAALIQAHFFKILGLDTNKKLSEKINSVNTILSENLRMIARGEKSILDAEITRQNVLETVNVIIQQVSQQYLTEDWSSPEKQKEKDNLYQAIISILAQFTEYSSSEHLIIKSFASELLLLSFISINNTLVLQFQDLEKEVNCLQESLDNRLKQFFSSLLMQLNKTETSTLILNEIINAKDYKLLPNHPLTIKLTHIYTKLAEKGIEQYSIEQLNKSYEEQFANSIEDFASLYQLIKTFTHDLIALRNLVPSKKIEVEDACLARLVDGLVVTAAERFYKERPQALPPIAPAEAFMRLTEQYAIKHFGLVDRSKAETNGPMSGTLSFFWNPVSRFIYGAEESTQLPGETATKSTTLS